MRTLQSANSEIILRCLKDYFHNLQCMQRLIFVNILLLVQQIKKK